MNETSLKRKISISPVFIGGTYGSGTWLLTQILEQRTSVAFLDEESHFYRYFFALRKKYPDLRDKQQMDALLHIVFNYKKFDTLGISREEVYHQVDELRPKSIEDFFEAIWLISLKKNSGKKYWGDKSPLSEYFWLDVVRKYPDAKFIYCLRNPKAVYLSNKTRFDANIISTSIMWNRSIDELIRLLPKIRPSQLMIVKYEDLCGNYEEALSRLEGFLGIPFDENYQDKLDKKNVPEGSLTLKDGISTSGIDRYKAALCEREQSFIDLICDKYSNIFEYPPTKASLINRAINLIVALRYIYIKRILP